MMGNGDFIIILALSASALLMVLAYAIWGLSMRFPATMITDILRFLNRPYGGVEVEIIYGLSELWFAMVFTLSAQALLNMTTTESLYQLIPHRIVAVPWWLSSMATLSGLILFSFGNRWCAPLRWFGALISAWIWSVMFARGLVETGGALGSLSFYFFGAVWQIRIMMSAWSRWGGAWHWYGGTQ